MIDLLTLITFVVVTSVVWLLARMLLKPRRTLVPASLLEGTSAADASEARSQAWVESLAGVLPQVAIAGEEELTKDLRRAGYYRPSARLKFFAWRNGLVIAAVLLTGLIVVAIGPQYQQAVIRVLMVGLVAALVLFVLPHVILAIDARRRIGRVSNAMPDALDTISMCLQGGLSLQESLSYVGREMLPVHPDLGLELLMVSQHAEINSFEFAVQQFAGRIDAPEVVSLVSLVTQNQRLGTGIVDSIREFADNLRLKRRQTAEAKAGRAEMFLLFPVVFCLVPSILLILCGPPVLSIIEFLRGPATILGINV